MVGGRGDHFSDELLDVPPRLEKVDCEVVEQCLMAGPISLCAEVLGSHHKACSKDHLPIAVYGNAGGERVLGIGDPTCQAESVLREFGRKFHDTRGRGSFDRFARFVILAAHQNVVRTRLGLFGGNHGDDGLLFDGRLFLLQCFQLLSLSCESGPSAAKVSQASLAILWKRSTGRGCFVCGQL